MGVCCYPRTGSADAILLQATLLGVQAEPPELERASSARNDIIPDATPCDEQGCRYSQPASAPPIRALPASMFTVEDQHKRRKLDNATVMGTGQRLPAARERTLRGFTSSTNAF